MQKNEIFNILKKSIMDVLPLVTESDIKPEQKLFDLGANSIDRSEIIITSMAALKLKIPASELGKAKNIEGLIDVFYNALNKS